MTEDAWSAWTATAERYSAAARRYLATLAEETGTSDAAAARQFGDFLRAETPGWLRTPWQDRYPAPGAQHPFASQNLPADLPALGLTREHQRLWQRIAAAAERSGEAQRRLQCLWSDVLRDAADAFVLRLGASAGASRDPSVRGLYDSWIDCAEAAYARIAHGADFCAALADFVNAGSAWRREIAAATELWSKLWDLPTRSEVTSLERRLKSLEAQLDAGRAAQGKP